MKRNPVGWFEIYVQDVATSVKFYETVFATTLTELPTGTPGMEMWGFPMHEGDTPGAPGALVKMEGMNDKPSGECGVGGGALVYFSCKDCANEASRVQAAGGQLLKEKFSIGEHGFIAMAMDPEGHMIGLHSMK